MATLKYLSEDNLKRIFSIVKGWDETYDSNIRTLLANEVKALKALLAEAEGGAETLVQNALEELYAHSDDTTVHITANEREAWNIAKAQIAAIIGENNNGVIDRWMEIVRLLDNTPEGSNLAAMFATKVDKVDGKGLSSNDFTDALLAKLNGLSNFTHPTATATTLSAANGKVLSAITVSNLGHVTSVSQKALAVADIPDLTTLTDAQVDALAKAATAVTLTA